MNPLTFPVIAAERQNYPACGWFFDSLEEFLRNLQEWQVDAGGHEEPDGIPRPNGSPAGTDKPKSGIPHRNGLPCGDCKFTYYFYFSPLGGYRNGIWIQVDNQHKLDVWLRVGLSKQQNNSVNKKVEIWSRCPLNCLGIYMTFHPSLALPHYFTVRGIFKTEERVHDTTFNDILQQICNLMPCVCIANCI